MAAGPYNQLMIKHFALVAAAVAALVSCSFEDTERAPSIDPTLLATPLVGLDNRAKTLEEFHQRALVINFWARWCDPCRREIPDLIAEHARLKNEGLEIVGIAIEDDPVAVKEFAAKYGIDYPVLLAKDQGFGLLQGMGDTSGGLPYTVVLDRERHVRARKLGALSKQEMSAAFEAALN